jgi:hypothetical protein
MLEAFKTIGLLWVGIFLSSAVIAVGLSAAYAIGRLLRRSVRRIRTLRKSN